jgi:effector-binding domain-containing protein
VKIELSQQEAQPILSIRTRTSLEKLPQLIGNSYHRIAGYLEELGEKPADVPFTAYYNLDMQNMDIEMGFPVSRALPGRDDIKASETMAGKAALYMYKGPYSEMEPVYNEIFKWIAQNGYQPAGVYYEYYYNSPGEVAESELLTRIVIPLK